MDPRTLSPEALLAAVSARFGVPFTDASAARAAVEAATERHDGLLLALRALESATEGFPPAPGGLRRGRLIEQDAISATFEARDARGQRYALRLLRPELRRDPVWRRRLERSPQLGDALCGPGDFVEDEGWPGLRTRLDGPSLSDWLPAEDPPESTRIAALMVGGLRGLSTLHSRGLAHGTLSAMHLICAAEGVRLAWFDPVSPVAPDPVADIAALGAAVAALDPDGDDPIAGLARAWAEDPPPDVAMAETLLRRTLAAELASRRHRAAFRSRARARQESVARLYRLARRLGEALPPPRASVCLRADADGLLVVAISADGEVRGGVTACLPPPEMPLVYGPKGLDASAARSLTRAWTARSRGDESARATAMEVLGGSDAEAEALCRWLNARARLRAVRMLMEKAG